METLVIAVGEQRSTVAEIIRGRQAPFTLGRALHNDVVLTDPYVGAEQLRFYQRDGHWFATVLDDVNPVMVNDEPVESGDIALASGDRLTIGRTHLEVYSEDYRVEPARKLLLSSWLYHGRRALFIALLATVFVAALDALIDYFEYSEQRSWEGLLNT
ncbi:MAG: FHA domain-containing protein, partial [Pseudomonadales bacterium]